MCVVVLIKLSEILMSNPSTGGRITSSDTGGEVYYSV